MYDNRSRNTLPNDSSDDVKVRNDRSADSTNCNHHIHASYLHIDPRANRNVSQRGNKSDLNILRNLLKSSYNKNQLDNSKMILHNDRNMNHNYNCKDILGNHSKHNALESDHSNSLQNNILQFDNTHTDWCKDCNRNLLDRLNLFQQRNVHKLYCNSIQEDTYIQAWSP